MKVRLIKAGASRSAEQEKPPPEEFEIADTLRSWVHQFKSDKANRPRLDLPESNDTAKTKAPLAGA